MSAFSKISCPRSRVNNTFFAPVKARIYKQTGRVYQTSLYLLVVFPKMETNNRKYVSMGKKRVPWVHDSAHVQTDYAKLSTSFQP